MTSMDSFTDTMLHPKDGTKMSLQHVYQGNNGIFGTVATHLCFWDAAYPDAPYYLATAHEDSFV